MEEEKEDDGSVFFRTTQNFDNGCSVVAVCSFDTEDILIDFGIFRVANVSDPLKKEAVHKLMNDLNKHYRFAKFTEENGVVSINYASYYEPDGLNPKQVVNMLLMLLEAAEESYPKFMKLQWA